MPSPQSQPLTGRLAPSPTGHLHIGHARSFLLAWWHIRSRGGRILLRLEDLDASRVKPGMEEAVLEDLAWLGLDWDGQVVRQSDRHELYRAAIAELEAQDLLYSCTCTRKEIEAARSAPHRDDQSTAYPGTCRGRYPSVTAARQASGREPALRLRVAPGHTSFSDLLHGEQPAPIGRSLADPDCATDIAATVGDFPVMTREGIPAYQLSVVVDDAAQGVTEVLRGDDLLSSTARQTLLQEHLKLPHPTWIHVPLVEDHTGRRLAKRSDDLSLAHLRALGHDPRRVIAWAARSAGQQCDDRPTATDLVAGFDIQRLPRAATRMPKEPLELF